MHRPLEVKSVIFDFPKDMPGALRQYRKWEWYEATDGQSATLELLNTIPPKARGIGKERDGAIMVDALWLVHRDGVEFLEVSGKYAAACMEGGRGEETVLCVLGAAVIGCLKQKKTRHSLWVRLQMLMGKDPF